MFGKSVKNSDCLGQYVYEVLDKLGLVKRINYFTPEDEQFLRDHYSEYRKNRNLQELAKILGRTKQFICRKAKELGLTDKSSIPPVTDRERKILSDTMKTYLANHLHPKDILDTSILRKQKQ